MKIFKNGSGPQNILFPVLINIAGCAISMAITGLMNYSLISIALAALVFLICQGIIFTVFRPLNDLHELRDHWFILPAILLVLLRTLLTLAQYYFRIDSAQSYGKLGVLLTVMMFYGIGVFLYFSLRKNVSFEKYFILQALIFGTALNMAFPVNEIADEPQHMRTAYHFSNQLLGIKDENDGVYMRADDATYAMSYPSYDLRDFNQYLDDLKAPLKNKELILVTDNLDYSPTLEWARRPLVFKTELYQYFAPALGIAVGRLLNFNTITMYLTGRLFSLLFYILLIAVSLKLLPVGKSLLYTISLFPMCLQLAASFSRDTFRIAGAVLVVALTLNLFWGEENPNKKKIPLIIALIISAGLVLPLRTFVYSMFAVLPLFVYFYRKKWLTDKMIIITAFSIATLVLIAIFLKYVVFPGNIVEEPQIKALWMDDIKYSKQYFINHPLDMLSILRNTFWVKTVWYIDTMIGSSLGWLDTPVPDVLVRIFFCLIPAAAAARTYETAELSRLMRFTLFVFACLSIVLIIAGITITWTPMSFSYAEGVQGRYFLPILFPLLLAFRGKEFKVSENFDIIMIVIQFAALIYTVELLMLRMM